MSQAIAKPSSEAKASSSSPSPSPSSPTPSSWARPLRQFSLFFLGASFTAASIAISRRSVLRRKFQSIPRYYTSNPPPPQLLSHQHHDASSDGTLLGLQALGLATLNVSSFAVLLTGGLAWGFDLSSVEELRERTQRALRAERYAVNKEDEEEFERMVRDVLVRFGLEKVQGEEETAETKG